MMELWAAFLLGLFGSLHCVGMCGPIALSLPITSKEKFSIVIDLLIYNIGRIITYAFIGLIVGFFGRFLFYNGWQQAFSITSGILIITSVLFFSFNESQFAQWLGVYKLHGFLSKAFGKFLNRSGKGSLLIIGLLNGFLPCGLVYMAVAGAFTNYHIADAVLYMVFFGIGTLPLMLGVIIVGKQVQQKFRINKIIPAIALIVGLLLIVRGLGLGIPYFSPVFEYSESQVCM